MILELKNLTFKYSKFSLKNMSVKFNSGEIVCVVGNNACGKTTLLQLLAGLLKPKKGEILIDEIPQKKSNAKIGIVFQNPDSQVIFNKVYDDIHFTLKNFKVPENEIDERIKTSLEKVGMEDFIQSEIFELSTGQKQRIVIANMLAINPDIIIFDESSSYLDAGAKQDFYKLLFELKNEGKIVIFSTNILEEIVYADRILMISNGEIVEDLPRKEAIKNYKKFEELGLFIPLKIKLANEYMIESQFDDDFLKELKSRR